MSDRTLPPIGQRIRTERKRLGLTQKRLAEAVGVTRPSATQWETKGQIETDNLRKLARIFGVSVDWLMTGNGARRPAGVEGKIPETRVDSPLTSSPIELKTDQESWPKDVPVYKTVAGENDSFLIKKDIIDRVRRPPGIAHRPNVYAILMTNVSMEPRFGLGEIVFADPDRPPTPGCDVVLTIQPADGEEALRYIKRLVDLSAEATTVLQFHPRRETTIPNDQIKGIDRILTPAELIGF